MLLNSKDILTELKDLKKNSLIRFKNKYGAITVYWEAIKTLLRSEESIDVSIRHGMLVVVAGKAIVKLYDNDGVSAWTINI